MIRAVLDANVLVSAILSPKGIPARILSAWRDEKFLVLVSTAIVDEIGRVLRYPKIRKRHGWPEARIQGFLEDLARLAVPTPGNLSLSIITADPTDNRYVECAVEGTADYLVSGDHHLLNLGTYESILILRPRAFFDVIMEQPKS